jgi:hypothetical protein
VTASSCRRGFYSPMAAMALAMMENLFATSTCQIASLLAMRHTPHRCASPECQSALNFGSDP